MNAFDPTSDQGNHSIRELATYLKDLKFMRFFPQGKTFLEGEKGREVAGAIFDPIKSDLSEIVDSHQFDLDFKLNRGGALPASNLTVYLSPPQCGTNLNQPALASLKAIEEKIEVICMRNNFIPTVYPDAISDAFDPDRWE